MMDPAAIEEFWDDLLAFIEARSVLPVVGSELLTVRDGDETFPLYRAVADRLLRKYGLPDTADLPQGTIRPHHELNDAIAVLAAQGKRVSNLYRPVHDLLAQLTPADAPSTPALAKLAEIRHFDLFATTTPDRLLARALNNIRFGGAPGTDEIEYAPKLPNDRRHDLPDTPSTGYTGVFYFFGRADPSPFYAIHDEDALEFPYQLQQGDGPERLFGQMRRRNLLFIGCHFAEWLSRFFIRMSTSERLFSDQRSTKEFLVGREDAQSLVLFLERFSRDSRSLPEDAAAFVDELHARWKQRNPAMASPAAEPQRAGDTSLSGSIFVSYASEDIAAARELVADVAAIGGDVAWFDKGALQPGDEWNRQIDGAIQRCAMFFALISSNTERRTEGYFRQEWASAVERARRIQGRKFLFPVVVDRDSGDLMSRFRLVPDAFRDLQFGHAPGGRLSDTMRAEVTGQLRALRRDRSA